VWPGLILRSALPWLNAVRPCLERESTSELREVSARRHCDQRRSLVIRCDHRATKCGTYAVDPSSWFSDWVIGCRLCQNDPALLCFNGVLHIESSRLQSAHPQCRTEQ